MGNRSPASCEANSGSCASAWTAGGSAITYYIASGRRIVLLTVFVKTQRQERREIDRAEKAMQRCIAEGHTVEED